MNNLILSNNCCTSNTNNLSTTITSSWLQVLAIDSSLSDWIYIVRSGSLSVFRKFVSRHRLQESLSHVQASNRPFRLPGSFRPKNADFDRLAKEGGPKKKKWGAVFLIEFADFTCYDLHLPGRIREQTICSAAVLSWSWPWRMWCRASWNASIASVWLIIRRFLSATPTSCGQQMRRTPAREQGGCGVMEQSWSRTKCCEWRNRTAVEPSRALSRFVNGFLFGTSMSFCLQYTSWKK